VSDPRDMRSGSEGACRECARRSWLLSRLGGLLDFPGRDHERLLKLLALEDERLIEAIAGRRRAELKVEWERFELGERASTREARISQESARRPTAGVETACMHSPLYPPALRIGEGLPRMLHVVGGAQRLQRLTAQPAVAIVGSARPTDYGIEMARYFARGLTASGVTIVSALANGIAAGAHTGALEGAGSSVIVMTGGVDVIVPASRRGLYERAIARGCAVAELPCGHSPRRWCELARARVIAGLAQMTIVIEAGKQPSELSVPRVARALGRTLAAVPGRITSPASTGTNALLKAGAPLLRGPADALDLLYGVGEPRPPRLSAPGDALRPARLSARLQAVLEQVGAGDDTPGKLTAEGEDGDETLLALAELELMGLLGRGHGGRYVPRTGLEGR
jgi:DNA processing protein